MREVHSSTTSSVSGRQSSFPGLAMMDWIDRRWEGGIAHGRLGPSGCGGPPTGTSPLHSQMQTVADIPRPPHWNGRVGSTGILGLSPICRICGLVVLGVAVGRERKAHGHVLFVVASCRRDGRTGWDCRPSASASTERRWMGHSVRAAIFCIVLLRLHDVVQLFTGGGNNQIKPSI